MTDAYDPEALEAVIEYFSQRADAEYFPDRASPVPNEAMRHLSALRPARDEIARLTALSTPIRVEDTEVVVALLNLATCCRSNSSANKCQCVICKAADLIRRLAAAKASGEAERDDARTSTFAQRAYVGMQSAKDEAETRAETAEAKLREARGLALEEAAKVVEAIADNRFREHGSTEPDTNASYYQGSQAEFYEAQDEENENCVAAIRALKQRS